MTQVLRFLIYNVLFALLPLAIAFVIRFLAERPAPLSAYIPEIMFLGILVSITAMGDIGNERMRISERLTFDVVHTVLLICVIIEVAIFGAYTYDTLEHPLESQFRSNVAIAAIVLTPIMCLTGITAEVLLARMRGGT